MTERGDGSEQRSPRDTVDAENGGVDTADTPRERMRMEVAEGLSQPQKHLSPKYFYDARGSELFEEITRLPEYYLTRTERALLLSFAPGWMRRMRPLSLVELGAGSAEKTRILLEAMHVDGAHYVPVDISAAYLAGVAETISEAFPRLEVVPAESDISAVLDLPAHLPGPTVYAFLGSTIGNFDDASAASLLRRVRAEMEDADRFLMGVDLRKDPAVLEAAYNDSRGVTAAFNRNILVVLNRELGCDFDSDDFAHRAFYDAVACRVEMHLVARHAQTVHVPGVGSFSFDAGETIHTEISCKYDRRAVEGLFDRAGLVLEDWVTDAASWYALVVGRPRP